MRHRELVPVLVISALALWGCDRRAGEPVESAEKPKEAASETAPSGTETPPGEQEERYGLDIRPDRVPVGESAEVTIAIEPASGLKINERYPSWSIGFETTEEVELDSATFERDDFDLSPERATVRTNLRTDRAGSHQLTGRATFSVCTDKKCHVLRDEAVQLALRAGDGDGAGSE